MESGRSSGDECAPPTQGIRDHVGLVATDRRADAAPGKRRARSRATSRATSSWARTEIISAVVALLIGIGQYSFPAVSNAQTAASPARAVALPAADQSCLPVNIPVAPTPA